jgi:hypothetical protein
MKRVYMAAHLPEAQMLVHALESNGIKARVFNESLQGGIGELPHIYPEVWVENEGDWERARVLVEKFERDVTRDKGVVRCPQCREDNPASFEICWRCGAAFPPIDESDGREEEENQ